MASPYEYFLKVFPSLNTEAPRHEWIRSELRKIPHGKRILDAGAGECIYKEDCKHLKYTSQDFCQYDGKGNGKGLQRTGWRHPHIDVVSDVENIPLPDGSFDVILCTEVFEHIPHPQKAVQEFQRLLKKGGVLLITAPMASQTHFAPYHFSSGFNKYWYKTILPEEGFKIVRITPSGNYWTYLRSDLQNAPGAMRHYSRIPGLWILSIPIALVGIGLCSIANSCSKNSEEQVVGGYFVKATKK